MWKKTFLILALVTLCLVLIPSARAEWQDQDNCKIGTPCTIQRLVTDNLLIPTNAAFCNITISNETSLLVNRTNMTNLGTGYYNYTFIPNVTGRHPSFMECGMGSNTSAIQDVSFTSQRSVSRFMGFEIIAPTILFALALVCLWGMTYFGKGANDRNQQGKYRFAFICGQHGLAIMALVLFATATFVTQEIVRYENTASNLNLTNLTNVYERVIIAEFALFTLAFALIMVFFIIRGVTLFREIKLARIREQEMI